MDRFLAEAGASAVEYALFVGLIAAVIITVVAVLGGQVIALFGSVEGEF